MSLWTAQQAAAATGVEARGNWVCSGVSIDTRTLEPGDLFVALKDQRDGHEFVAQALEKGAGAAMVSHLPEGVAADAPLLVVPDVLAALEDLGRAARDRTSAKVAAVTGSVGKTSTKEMLRAMLADQGATHASVASYNNHWGVPLTLARMPRNTDFAVIEIGMNHPGEIAPLARMARPDVAMVTTVAAAHLEAFDSVAAIAVEKASIYEGLPREGTAVLNADIEHAAILMAKTVDCKVRPVEFGTHGHDFKLLDVSVQDGVTVARAEAGDMPILYKIASPGRHFAMNGLGALAVVDALGADLALAAHALGRWHPYSGRGGREQIVLDPVERLSLTLLDDSYNANPTSMAAALAVLAEDPGQGRKVAFIGDMKELGPTADALHAELADLPAMAQIDQVHCIGPHMRTLHEALPTFRRGAWTDTAEEMVAEVKRSLGPDDVVLAKGSLSMKLALIVDAIRKMGHPGKTT